MLTPAEASAEADVIMVLAPDTAQRKHLRRGDRAEPDRRQGALLRPRLQHPVRPDHAAGRRGRGDGRPEGPRPPGPPPVSSTARACPCLVAVEQDATGNACALALSYAKGIGGTRAGAIKTTFKEETETDLFGEQAVLCGGAAALVQTGFEVLTEAGYAPEIAYFECLHELKLIVDLMYEGGIARMRYSDLRHRRVRRLLPRPARRRRRVKDEMRKILGEIQSGEFAREWIAEDDAGRPNFTKWRERGRGAPDRGDRPEAALHDELGRPPPHRDRLTRSRRPLARC